MDSPIYIRVGQRKEVPSKNTFTFGENMDKVPSKIKTEAAKGCDWFCHGSWELSQGLTNLW